MKISYRTHKILEMYNNRSLGKLEIFPEDEAFFNNEFHSIKHFWKDNIDNFKSQITIITKPFQDATITASDKLSKFMNEFTIEDNKDYNISGTFFYGNVIMCIHTEFKKGNENYSSIVFAFDKDMTPLLLSVKTLEPFTVNGSNNNYEAYWVSKIWRQGESGFTPTPEDKKMLCFSEVGKVIMFDLFRKYAQVETKYLPPKKTIKEFSAKYVNETNHGVTILDSKWFTTLIKSDSFKVRGHFRLQPKKINGEWTKEIIWIADFEKTGYTSKAKILDQTI